MKLPLLCLAGLALLGSCTAAPSRRSSVRDGEPLEDVFRRVREAVVTIRTTSELTLPKAPGEATTAEGVGSGTIVSADGKILTAAHVVQSVDTVQVQFFDGRLIPGRVVGSEPFADIALVELLQDPPPGMQVATLADSDLVRVGSSCFVVGAPRGISHTLTVGHVSAKRSAPTVLDQGTQLDVFQTDAAINPGNSGGPMFNMAGELIGTVSYIVTKSGGSEGLGFAVSSNTSRELLLDRSSFWSGVNFIPVTGRFAELLNLPNAGGFLVQRVAKDSPGERLGIRGGDIPATLAGHECLLGGDVVLEVLGIRMIEPSSRAKLRSKLDKLGPQDPVKVVVLRAGKSVTLEKPIDELRALPERLREAAAGAASAPKKDQ